MNTYVYLKLEYIFPLDIKIVTESRNKANDAKCKQEESKFLDIKYF